MNIDGLAKFALSFLPKGYATKFGGLLMIIGGLGLGADYIGSFVGIDVLPGSTSWVAVTAMLGAGYAILGGRRAIETIEEKVSF